MKIPRSKAAQAEFSLCLLVQLGCAGYPKKFAALFRANSFRRKITSIANFGIIVTTEKPSPFLVGALAIAELLQGLTISKKYVILIVRKLTIREEVKKMITTVSSRHQITIPKSIAVMFNLKKGDVLEVERQDNKIIMIPKEVILEDKYPVEALKAAEKVLSEVVPKEEVKFKSGNDMVKFFKNKTKK